MIKILNQAAIVSNFSRASKSTVQSTRDALNVIGNKGTTIVKDNSPIISGRLRDSFGYTIDGKVSGNQNNETIKPSSEKNTVVIGTSVVYAASVEYLAKPPSFGFMERSFNQLKQIVKKTMSESIKKGLG